MTDPNPTVSLTAGIAAPGEGPPEQSEKVGRYTVRRMLGRGGFGTVYLAHDEELRRLVAVKLPHRSSVANSDDAESYLTEARLVAGLDHPNIVPVYDVGRTDVYPCYIVSKYIEGTTLARSLREARPGLGEAAALLTQVAEALHYAHRQGVVHRDVKPGNILLDVEGRPYVTDFGLALAEGDVGQGPRYPGTPAYMSPEQARGEGHRVDARSDVFSLGVVLYEMLTGALPFRGKDLESLLAEVIHGEPRPPRQMDEAVPRALDRICLKALSKRASERYSTARDMADDLRHFLEVAPSPLGPAPAAPSRGASGSGTAGGDGTPHSAMTARATPASGQAISEVVPRGLRSFDARDAEFFLELLPGPRNREGLPDGLAFWKGKVEETDGAKTFSLGLMYGPSGCGKSSQVKAGLLPRLAGHVRAVYVEATAGETEARLLAGLRKACPGVPGELTLRDTLAHLRRGGGLAAGEKVLLVVDQFEQWLYARRKGGAADLVEAFRQCDGGRVQGLVLVRDDFWMAVSSFFRDVDVPLREGENSAPVPLFGPRHARKVLLHFGQAYGALGERAGALSAAQERFLDRAVAELAHEGEVVPVRLSLFAEMMKERTWEPSALRGMGGLRGLGVTFLEATFRGATAAPGHRRHERAARAVLQALLPEEGTNIKGASRSREDLLAASGYEGRPAEFDDLLTVLDTELRLMTPADPESGGGPASYQLTHDYLVPSLREWLTGQQKATWRGRAGLALHELSAQWGRGHDRRFLLSLPEYLAVRAAVPRGRQTPEQQAFLAASGRRAGWRWGAVLAAAAAVGLLLQAYRSRSLGLEQERRAQDLVEQVQGAAAGGVPYAVEKLQPLAGRAVPRLRERMADRAAPLPDRLRSAVSLSLLGEGQAGFLAENLGAVPNPEGRNVLAALGADPASARERLGSALAGGPAPEVRARLAAALLHLGDPAEARSLLQPAKDPAPRVDLVRLLPWWQDAGQLAALLGGTDGGLRSGLCLALGAAARDGLLDTSQRGAVAEALGRCFREAADGGTHGAALWALRQVGADVPAVAPGGPRAGWGWFVGRGCPGGLTMLAVLPGQYVQGDVQAGADPREVTLTRPYFLADREVSCALFRQFLADREGAAVAAERAAVTPSQRTPQEDDYPVVHVNWEDCAQFCNWLSRREGRRPCYRKTGRTREEVHHKQPYTIDEWEWDTEADGYRLPTEAEWEYACRAGTATAWCCGEADRVLADYAVYHPSRLAPRGSRMPNAWGFFDLHGSVREWCWDTYEDKYPPGPAEDPRGPEQFGVRHVHRGGSWYDYAGPCRSAYRNHSDTLRLRDSVVGFRVACNAPTGAAAEGPTAGDLREGGPKP